jgi:glycosyltransferase involved in cell wall biosynthesis
LRIAVDARPLARPATGIGRFTGALLRAWPRAEDTFLLYSDRPLPALSIPARHALRTGRRRHVARGTPFAQLCFGRWAREDRADVFWSPRHHLPRGLAGVPAVVTIHDLVWLLAPGTMRWSRRTAERVLMPRAIREAAAIVADSEATRRDIVAFFPGAEPRVRVIAGASELAPVDASPDGTPYMLFVGTLEPRKNLARVVQAFSALHESTAPRHRLVVVGGRGWKERGIRAAMNGSVAADRIEVRGQVSDDELSRLYAGADFVVAPSLYEGFGLQLVEAFAAGKPVITSDRGAMPEVAGDAGILVDPGSTTAIQEAMSRLISDRPYRDALASAARARSKLFSWQTAARQMLEVFEMVAAADSTPR